MTSSRAIGVAAGLAGLLLLTACGGSAPTQPAEAETTSAAANETAGDAPAETAEVTYLTSFNTFGRDAYAYVAQEKGFFEEAGLKVTIQPGTGTVDVMKLIASGSADFGTGDFSTVVVTVANEGLPVTTTGVIHQKSLAAIISIDGHGISEPTDLEGKTIGDQPGSTNQVIFPTYAAAAGIDPAQVEFVPAAPPALPQLLASGQVDAIGQFIVGEPLIASTAQGKDVVVLPYGDLLPELYGNVLLTSQKLAESDPDLVSRFTEALLRGLEYSIANPEETGEILRKYQPTQNPDVAAAEVTLMAPYVEGDGVEIGAIDPERVQAIIDIMAPALTGDVVPEDLVSFDLAPGGQQ
ncbi:ABC transporter substrate-binding protein [Georgenia yuyongxinii]|uniref:Thiamine pyrimidine synthase n=1 Tax=Georgenia yuyongxinii TaxID=2589797 RepID=A0A552WV33_9MICO|nr:ABC transporter substrate-binding protein [Georgenia yuyongxinii]TRW46566.1 ABC transporter substrate-binding protein [Georgenia yuyongxinii]